MQRLRVTSIGSEQESLSLRDENRTQAPLLVHVGYNFRFWHIGTTVAHMEAQPPTRQFQRTSPRVGVHFELNQLTFPADSDYSRPGVVAK
jgi:hypothetical protein